MANEEKWAIRRVRPGGRVKVGGHWYKVDETHLTYDGRLDGRRMAFGRYRGNDDYEPYLYMGTEDKAERPDVVDGHLNWCWWSRED